MSILNNLDEYKYWRDDKLANSNTNIETCLIEINNPFKIIKSEKDKIKLLCQKIILPYFILNNKNYPRAIIAINKQLGLIDYDSHLYVLNQGLTNITKNVKKTKLNLFHTPINPSAGTQTVITTK